MRRTQLPLIEMWAPENQIAVHHFRWSLESIFLSRVEGRGFHVEGVGTKSRVEGNIFFLDKVIIDAINVIKTNKKNLKNKWRVNIF